ncbi:MAG: succinate dehydrogenase cytochrome b subunit [Verrucomicrobiales bacterium]
MSHLWKSLSAFLGSSIGKKIIVALSGAVFLLFLVGHLAGNMLVYAGPDAMNTYAAALKGQPALLWLARGGLLVSFVAHVVTTVLLVKQNKAARQNRYYYQQTIQASAASRYMIVSGLTILAFVVYHLMHFTLHIGNEYGSYVDAQGRADVYKMMVDGLSNVPVAMFYLVSMGLLCWHLSHGFASVFQTLGLNSDKFRPVIEWVGKVYAGAIFLGFASIPISILAGFVKY